jgi:ribosomal protein S18 acetylase RimI-like enzyme|tara:strand:- start:1301 stop:1558 length:258 start_codon:yes stop_codon:yes gene_type:complete
MNNYNINNFVISENDGVITFKNKNTTIGFIRFNKKSEIEYIFVNPSFRRQGLAKKLLELTKKQTGKELIPQKPISPLGKKLFNIV